MLKRYRLHLALVMILFLVFLLHFAVNVWIRNTIIKTINTSYIGHHHISIEKTQLRFLPLSLIAVGVRISYDKDSANIEKTPNNSSLLIEAEFKKIDISGLKLIRLLQKHAISLGHIYFQDGRIRIQPGSHDLKQIINSGNTEQSEIDIPIDLERFHLENIGFEWVENDDKDILKGHLAKVTVSEMRANLGVPGSLHYGNADFELDDLEFYEPSGNYLYKSGQIEFIKNDKELIIKNITIDPQKGLHQLAAVFPVQKDAFKLSIGEIGITGFELDSLMYQQRICIQSIRIDSMQLSVFKDKRLLPDLLKRPPMPQSALRDLAHDITLDTLQINDSYIWYGEGHENEDARINLNDFNARITGITNNEASILKGCMIEATIEASLMGRSKLKTDFILPLNTANDTFYFTGSMNAMTAGAFNLMTLPAAGVEFTDGRIEHIRFSGGGNSNFSEGIFEMRYNNLEVKVNNKKAEKNKFLSWIINIAIKRNNPFEGRGLRIVDMYHERDLNKGFINNFWKTIQNGIMHTVAPAQKRHLIHSKRKKHKQSG